MDITEIQRIIISYTICNYMPEEMDKFLEKYNLPRLNQDEMEKMLDMILIFLKLPRLDLWPRM